MSDPQHGGLVDLVLVVSCVAVILGEGSPDLGIAFREEGELRELVAGFVQPKLLGVPVDYQVLPSQHMPEPDAVIDPDDASLVK